MADLRISGRKRQMFCIAAAFGIFVFLMLHAAGLIILNSPRIQAMARREITKIMQAYGAEIKIGKIKGLLFSRLAAEDITVSFRDRGDVFASVPRLVISYDPLAVIFRKWGGVVKTAGLEKPVFNISRGDQGWTWQRFIIPRQKKAELALDITVTVRGGVINLAYDDGAVKYGDQFRAINGRLLLKTRSYAGQFEGSSRRQPHVGWKLKGQWLKPSQAFLLSYRLRNIDLKDIKSLIPGLNGDGKWGDLEGGKLSAEGKLKIEGGELRNYLARLRLRNSSYLLPEPASIRMDQVNGDFIITPRRTQVAFFQGKILDGYFHARGTITDFALPRIDLSVRINRLNLARFGEDLIAGKLCGMVAGKGKISGRISCLKWEGEVEAKNVSGSYRGVTWTGGRLRAVLNQDRVRILEAGMHHRGLVCGVNGEITGNGKYWDNPSLKLSVTAESKRKITASRLELPAGFTVDRPRLKADIGGFLSAPEIRGSLQADSIDLTAYGQHLGKPRLSFRYENDRIVLDNLSFEACGGKLRGKGELNSFTDGSPAYSIAVSLDNIQLERFLQLAAGYGKSAALKSLDFRGEVTGRIAVQKESGGDLKSWFSFKGRDITCQSMIFLDTLEAAGNFAGNQCNLEYLQGVSKGGIIHGSGILDKEGMDLSFSVEHYPLQDIEKTWLSNVTLFNAPLNLGGHAYLQLKLAGPWKGWQGRGTISVENGSIRHRKIQAAEAGIIFDARKISVEDCEIKYMNGVFLLNGGYEFLTGDMKWDISSDDLSLDELNQFADAENQFFMTGTGRAKMTISSRAGKPEVSGYFQLKAGAFVWDQAIEEGRVKYSWTRDGGLILSELFLRAGKTRVGGMMTIHGLGAESRRTLELSVDNLDLSPMVSYYSRFYNLSISGGTVKHLTFKGDLRGLLEAGGLIDGVIELEQIAINLSKDVDSCIRLKAVKGGIAIDPRNNRYKMDNLVFFQNEEQYYRFNGQVALKPSNNSAWEGILFDVEVGFNNAEIHQMGELFNLKIPQNIQGKLDGKWATRADASAIESRLFIRDFTGQAGPDKADLQMDFYISAPKADFFEIWQGKFGWQKASKLSYHLADFNLAWGKGKISGAADLNSAGIKGSFACTDLDLTALAALLKKQKEMPSNISGDLDHLYANIDGTWQNPSLEFSLGWRNARYYQYYLGDLNIPSVILTGNRIFLGRQKPGEALVEPITVERYGEKTVIYGEIPVNPRLAGVIGLDAEAGYSDRIELHITSPEADMSFLPLILSELEWVRGKGALNMNITGTVVRPRLEGFFRTRGAEAKLQILPESLTNINVDLSFNGDKINIQTCRAESISIKSGFLRLAPIPAGEADPMQFLNPFKIECDFTAQASNFQVESGFFSGKVSTNNLNVKTRDNGFEVNGNLQLYEGEFRIKIEKPVPMELPEVHLNLKVKIGKTMAFKMDNNLDLEMFNPVDIEIPLSGEVAVEGTLSAPSLKGEIKGIGRGSMGLLTTRKYFIFDVTEAAATFHPDLGMFPDVVLKAQTIYADVGEDNMSEVITIYLTYEGSLKDIGSGYILRREGYQKYITLSSDPVRPETYLQGIIFGLNNMPNDVESWRKMVYNMATSLFFRDVLDISSAARKSPFGILGVTSLHVSPINYEETGLDQWNIDTRLSYLAFRKWPLILDYHGEYDLETKLFLSHNLQLGLAWSTNWFSSRIHNNFYFNLQRNLNYEAGLHDDSLVGGTWTMSF
ncbi:MAG: hypothetical protein ACM3WV_12140 [Bacillota bacterium]